MVGLAEGSHFDLIQCQPSVRISSGLPRHSGANGPSCMAEVRWVASRHMDTNPGSRCTLCHRSSAWRHCHGRGDLFVRTEKIAALARVTSVASDSSHFVEVSSFDYYRGNAE